MFEPMSPDLLVPTFLMEEVGYPAIAAVVDNQKIHRVALQQLCRTFRLAFVDQRRAWALRERTFSGFDSGIDFPNNLSMGPPDRLTCPVCHPSKVSHPAMVPGPNRLHLNKDYGKREGEL